MNCLLQLFFFPYRLQLALVSDGKNKLLRLSSSSNWYREVDRRTTICGSFSGLYLSYNLDERKTSSIRGSIPPYPVSCNSATAGLINFFVIRPSGRSKKEGKLVTVFCSLRGEESRINGLERILEGEGLDKSSISFDLILLCFLLKGRLVSWRSLNYKGSSSQLSSLEEASSEQPTFMSSLLVHNSLKISGLYYLLQKYFLRVRHNPLPMSLQCLQVKWCFSLMALQKECSMVQLQGRLRRWCTDSLDVPSRPVFIPKLH